MFVHSCQCLFTVASVCSQFASVCAGPLTYTTVGGVRASQLVCVFRYTHTVGSVCSGPGTYTTVASFCSGLMTYIAVASVCSGILTSQLLVFVQDY